MNRATVTKVDQAIAELLQKFADLGLSVQEAERAIKRIIDNINTAYNEAKLSDFLGTTPRLPTIQKKNS